MFYDERGGDEEEQGVEDGAGHDGQQDDLDGIG